MAIIISNRHRDEIVRALTVAMTTNATAEQRRRFSRLAKLLNGKPVVSAADLKPKKQ